MASASHQFGTTVLALTALALGGLASAGAAPEPAPQRADLGGAAASVNVTVNVTIPEILKLDILGFDSNRVPVRTSLDGTPGLKAVDPDGIDYRVTANTAWSLVITTEPFQGPQILPASRLEWNAGSGWTRATGAPQCALTGAGRQEGRLGLRFDARPEDLPGDYQSLVTLTIARL
ncbi:MAG TPA: hypothetical protein VHN99_03240 [Deinococcales bacterium]|nr:hypothetical protein [Deinococcales bacterium]